MIVQVCTAHLRRACRPGRGWCCNHPDRRAAYTETWPACLRILTVSTVDVAWMVKIFSSPRPWATSEDFHKGQQDSTVSFFRGGSRTRIQPCQKAPLVQWSAEDEIPCTTRRCRTKWRFRCTSKGTAEGHLVFVNVPSPVDRENQIAWRRWKIERHERVPEEIVWRSIEEECLLLGYLVFVNSNFRALSLNTSTIVSSTIFIFAAIEGPQFGFLVVTWTTPWRS